ncbi:MAG: outer membrane protein assembly factor BamD, partial [Marinobacter maritimus]
MKLAGCALHIRRVPRYNTALEFIDIIRDSGMRSGFRLLLLSTLVVLISACASNKQEEVL